jgi:hypothetical protein
MSCEKVASSDLPDEVWALILTMVGQSSYTLPICHWWQAMLWRNTPLLLPSITDPRDVFSHVHWKIGELLVKSSRWSDCWSLWRSSTKLRNIARLEDRENSSRTYPTGQEALMANCYMLHYQPWKYRYCLLPWNAFKHLENAEALCGLLPPLAEAGSSFAYVRLLRHQPIFIGGVDDAPDDAVLANEIEKHTLVLLHGTSDASQVAAFLSGSAERRRVSIEACECISWLTQ